MCKTVNISESEWEVMKVIWQNPYSTLKEITGCLADKNWRYSTIRTLVNRLHEKGAVGADTSIANYKYYPLVSEQECRREETKKFLNKLYNGSVKVLVGTLLSDSKLSEEEVEKLMKIIDKIED